MSEQEKKGILGDEFGVPMTEDVDEEVNNMCNFSEGIYQHGIEVGEARGEARGKAAGIAEGEARGKASGQATSVVSLMKALDIPVEQALDTLSVPEEDRPAVLELVNAQLAMN